jgi:hypothetical protein
MRHHPLNDAAVMSQAFPGNPRRKLGCGAIVGAIVLVVGLLLAGIGLAGVWLNDDSGTRAPGATGSGPCGSADSVIIEMVFANGHTVRACTHDRPACPNQTPTASDGWMVRDVAEFTLSNQLRSTSRRYIFSIRFEGALPAEATEQTLALRPGAWMWPGAPASPTLANALLVITPRDPTEFSYEMESGSLTVSSTSGVARGRIDGAGRRSVGMGSSATRAPLSITGTFACNHS